MAIKDTTFNDIPPTDFTDKIGEHNEWNKLAENYNRLKRVATGRPVPGGTAANIGHDHDSDSHGGPTIPLVEQIYMGQCLQPYTANGDTNGNGLFVSVAPMNYMANKMIPDPDRFIDSAEVGYNFIQDTSNGYSAVKIPDGGVFTQQCYAMFTPGYSPYPFCCARYTTTHGGDRVLFFHNSLPSDPAAYGPVMCSVYKYKHTGEYWNVYTPEWADSMTIDIPLGATYGFYSWANGINLRSLCVSEKLFDVWIEYNETNANDVIQSTYDGAKTAVSPTEEISTQYHRLSLDFIDAGITRGQMNKFCIRAELNEEYIQKIYDGATLTTDMKNSAQLWHTEVENPQRVPPIVRLCHRAG